MSDTSFFSPKGPFYLNQLSREIADNKNDKLKIFDKKSIDKATKKDITSSLLLTNTRISAVIKFKEKGILCGKPAH